MSTNILTTNMKTSRSVVVEFVLLHEYSAHAQFYDYSRGGASEASGATLTGDVEGSSRYSYVLLISIRFESSGAGFRLRTVDCTCRIPAPYIPLYGAGAGIRHRPIRSEWKLTVCMYVCMYVCIRASSPWANYFTRMRGWC